MQIFIRQLERGTREMKAIFRSQPLGQDPVTLAPRLSAEVYRVSVTESAPQEHTFEIFCQLWVR